ncbi:hypothetical protein LJR220_003414 [Bradyrhizobium sp. LjRoot220]|uniref:hypothetical protein n=1 Tax=Bradyrhizobium sp. LjRoot220 TaxID=3342284 RepID=UPI003ECE75E0
MGRVVRVLMKMPAVRRVMLRLANMEAAIAKQQSLLDALDGQRAQMSAEQAGQHAKLQEAVAKFERQQSRIAVLSDNVHIQQTQGATLLAQQARAATRDTVQAQQAQIDALLAQIRQLAADHEKHSAALAEVSQHLPPAQRANLEATLHGQQLQLGALNSTITAQQMQLAALNDIVRQISAAPESKPAAVVEAAAAESTQDQPSRPIVKPYTFEQLVSRQVERLGPDLVLNIHIPKAAGHTVNALFRQMGFIPLSLDMNTKDFFGTFREDRWFENYAAPPQRDPYLLTGHMRLDQPIFRRLWMQHVVVSMLRDPVERMISNYNFTLRRTRNPWHDEIVNKGMSFVEYSNRMLEAIGPQYSFFDDTGQGTFARTGMATAQECFANLLTKVSYYGLSDRFDEFAVMSGYFMGRARILAVPPINVTKDIDDTIGFPPKTELTDEERDGLTTALKDDIWFYQQAVKEYERRVSDHRLQAVLSQALPLVESSREAISKVLVLEDPADPSRRTFHLIK